MSDGAMTLQDAPSRHWRRSLLGIAVLLALWGCDGGSAPPAGEEVDSPSSTQDQALSSSQQDEAAAPSAPPVMSAPVSVTTTTQLTPGRRLEVAGETNLPEQTRLLVVLEREASGVNWQARTEVRNGAFTVGPLGPGSGLVAGRYVIRVSMPAADVQPAAVKARIGARGEHLTGPLVTRSAHGLGNVIVYSRDYLFDR